MYKLIFFIYFISIYSFSQDLSIETTAISDGYFQTLPSVKGKSLCEYKKKMTIIITKVGNEEWWYGKTKDCEGWIYGRSIMVNQVMKEALEEDQLILEREAKKRREIQILEEKKKEEEKEEKIKKEMEEREQRRLEQRRISDSLQEITNKNREEAMKKELYELRNNCHYIKNEIDEFDKMKTIITDYYSVKNGGSQFKEGYLSIRLHRKGANKYVYFSLDTDLGCASPYSNSRSYVKVKLENEDIITFYHSGDIDCSEFTLIGKISESEVLKLKKSPMNSIRLNGTEYYEDISDLKYKEFFIDKLKCIE